MPLNWYLIEWATVERIFDKGLMFPKKQLTKIVLLETSKGSCLQ